MARKRKARPKYNGQELPKGVTMQERNGSVYFYARIDGKRKFQGEGDTGHFLALKAVDAVKTDRDIVKLYDIGQDDLAGRLKRSKIDFSWTYEDERGSGKTVKDLLRWYITRPLVKKQQSSYRKRYHVAHIIRHLGEKHVAQLQGDLLEEYRETRLGEESSQGTINLEMTTLRAAYNLALKRGKIGADIIPGDFGTVEDAPPRREVTEEEYQALLEKADPDFRDFLICAWESAMRLMEIANLRVNRVHLNETHIEAGESVLAHYIELEPVDTKTGLRRLVPISQPLMEVLERRMEGKEPGDLIFTSDGVPYYRQWVTSKMKVACSQAEVVYGDQSPVDDRGKRTGIVFHCFRHTRTVRWLQKGFSDTYIRAATGHKSLAAYQTYADKGASPAGVMRLVNGVQKDGRKRHTKPAEVAL